MFKIYLHFRLKEKETDTRITRENLIKYYPTIYGIYTTNISYEEILLKGAKRLTPTNEYFNSNKNCSFKCVTNVVGRAPKSDNNRAGVYNLQQVDATTSAFESSNNLKLIVRLW